ncbi:MAG: hypothetical protein B9S32_15945 [Verrucomicrobia bacterium Tous-C9LFEB]|nr:MAG: hypothetical protein B9S32_15945 [Verrucomicrobia bacterium Tous-C9LFEB]
MTALASKLAVEVLSLPASVRALLAQKLISSLELNSDDDAAGAWTQEIDKRSREIKSGKVTCRSNAEVVQRLRKKLHASRRPSSSR